MVSRYVPSPTRTFTAAPGLALRKLLTFACAPGREHGEDEVHAAFAAPDGEV
ncbi:hypothetical protein GCM10010440_74860 [Kitasatospora cinereorecta]